MFTFPITLSLFLFIMNLSCLSGTTSVMYGICDLSEMHR